MLTSSQLSDWFSARGFPALWAITFFSIPIFSAVPVNLWVIKGMAASACVVAYGLLMLVLAVAPRRFPEMHAIGSALAVLVMGGRAGGFLELSIERGNWVLTAAVLERIGFAAALVLWHRARRKKAEREKEISVWTI